MTVMIIYKENALFITATFKLIGVFKEFTKI